MSLPSNMIDHLLWGVAELETGCRQLADLTGVEPSPGGRHPGFGTHNALLALGEETYLEILARDPTQDELRGFGEGLADLDVPRLLTWAARTNDLDALITAARSGGLEPGEVIALSRDRPDGTRMSCRLVRVGGHEFGPLVPFFIQFDEGVVHPARSAATGCSLETFRIRCVKAQEMRRVLDILGLSKIDIEETDASEMAAAIESPHGRIELRG